MESGRTFDIPCNLMDIGNMERFLEQKAREGYVLERYRWVFLGSTFQVMPEDEYCFHIDLYNKRLKKADLESEEFLSYVKGFEACGWTLAVLAALEVLLMWGNLNGNILRAPLLYIPLTWLLSTFLLDFFRYFSVVRRVKHLKSPLEKRMYWDEWSLGLAMFMAGAVGAVICFWENRTAVFLCLAFTLIVSSGILLGYRFRRFRRGKEPWRTSWVEIAGYLLPCLLLIALFTKLPFPGDFRYQLENGKSYFDTGLSGSSPAPEIIQLGLTQEELGWGVSELAFAHENPNRLCEWEWIDYSQESLQEFFARPHRDDAKDSRYIGTMMAKLKAPGKLDDYLRQKKLKPETGGSLNLVPGIQSWVCDGGKELVHVRGDLVVVHFLNQYDPRRFDMEDQKIREAVRNNLEIVVKSSDATGCSN